MLTRLTTDQFFRALQSCTCCLVDGWPAMVEWKRDMPKRRDKKWYARLRWVEWEQDAEKSPSTFYIELAKSTVDKIEATDPFTVMVTFQNRIGEEPMEIKFLSEAMVEVIAPAMRHIAMWKKETFNNGVELEQFTVSPIHGVN